MRENISLKTKLDDNFPEFYFDDEQMKQAVMNVLTNSIFSIKEKGEIIIRTLRENDDAVVEIIDTGIGISKENLADIFNPFFTTRQDGTGLGLAVTQRILEGHDGKIRVESNVNQGTVFRLILPLVFDISKELKTDNTIPAR